MKRQFMFHRVGTISALLYMTDISIKEVLIMFKVPLDGSDPIEEEITDGVSGTPLSNEYYYVSDEYGYFFHKIGEEGEDHIAKRKEK